MTARRIIVCSLLWLTLAAGCRSGQPAGDRGKDRPFTRHTQRYDVQLPPGLTDDPLQPLTGEGLEKAMLTLDEVLATSPRPGFLDKTPGQGPAVTEPPLAAQKAYVHGRRAWREGDSTAAKRNLEKALRLAPDQPTLLRLLGEIYTRTGNRIKGAQYFRRAVELAPADARSVFILGRFAIEKGDYAEAIVLFNQVLDAASTGPDADPALEELTHHFLGNTLRSAGYTRAAITQFNRYFELAARPQQPSRLARDQALLRRQIGVTRQLLGDLHLRLDKPAAALASYDLATRDGVPDRIKLDKRRVFAALRTGDPGLAAGLVIEMVQRQQGDAQSLAMVRYVVKQGVAASGLAKQLRSIYLGQGRPPELAIATADVLPTAQASALLQEHLQAAPEDRRVFHRLLRSYLLPESDRPASDNTLAQAAAQTADLMSRAPQLADEYGSALVTQVQDPQALLRVIDTSDAVGTDETMRIVLRGLVMAVLKRFDEAQTQFELAVQRAPDLAVARVELAKALIVQDRFDQAAQVLEPLADSNQTGVILLRSRVLAQTGKALEAVELIDRVIREGEPDARLVITKANLQLQLGRAQDAEQTLLDALNAQPKSEPLYEALLDLYDPVQGRPSPIEDQTAKWRVLVKRLLGTIPNSRTGRLVQAQLHDAGRNYDQASAILLELLAENPNDAKALNQLLDTYHAAGRTGEAIALLEERLATQPDNPLLLRMALRFYRAAGDKQRLFGVQERLLMLEPDSPSRAGQLGFLYRQWGKPQRAVEVLEAALARQDLKEPTLLVSLLAAALEDMDEPDRAEQRIIKAAERFPEREAELKYILATTVISRGDQARGEQIMHDLLARFPDHGPTNNGLGYAMLMRNEDPGGALKLIQRAVDSDPTNEAYMDSLGWAYYKLRRFEDAEVWLRKARESALARVREGGGASTATLAIISDHLADTLYQLGREREALRSWTEAGRYLGGVRPEEPKQDPELATLTDRLRKKIIAVRAKTPVPVSEAPGGAAANADSEPTPEPAQPQGESQKPQVKAEVKAEAEDKNKVKDKGKDQAKAKAPTEPPSATESKPAVSSP
jgi:tetratricopeptide (TPR) repeat protein